MAVVFGPPGNSGLKPPDKLVEEGLRLYRQAMIPMVVTAGAGALLSNVLGSLITPSSDATAFLWIVVLSTISVSTQAAVLYIAWEAKEGRPATVAHAIPALIRFGPRYVAAAMAIFLITGGLFLSFVLIPLAIFLWVRLGLAGPAIVLEDQTVAGAFRRSWSLVQDRWWRTFGLLILASLPLFLGLGVASIPSSLAAATVLGTIASAFTVPLVSVTELLLFLDYRQAEPESPRPWPPEQPPEPPEDTQPPADR